MDAARRPLRWTKARIRHFCHGGVRPDKKQRKDGCAALWPVWGDIGYFLETAVLLEEGMPAPTHFTREDWRAMHRIKRTHERVVEDRAKEAP